jgi:DNA-binding phage protein
MSAKFLSFEDLLGAYLENPEFAMSFLNQALADENIEAFQLSLKDIIRSQ